MSRGGFLKTTGSPGVVMGWAEARSCHGGYLGRGLTANPSG
ncbi:hypothetical protein [Paenarthrobacter sp. NPDC057981]